MRHAERGIRPVRRTIASAVRAPALEETSCSDAILIYGSYGEVDAYAGVVGGVVAGVVGGEVAGVVGGEDGG